MKGDLARSIAERLNRDSQSLNREFNRKDRSTARYVAIDSLLPEKLAREIFQNFPPDRDMRLMKTFRERKFTTKQLDKFHPILTDITFAFQAPEVIAAVETITGLREQHPDSHLYAGGLSAMSQGHFLNPHIDNSHESERKMYRTLNLLYYISPDWKEEYGGNLELWNPDVTQRVTIPSLFNRLVIMETNRLSWHSVSEVKVPERRACVSNYYFSPQSPDGSEYFHITAFSAPPERPFLRAFSQLDSLVRTSVRRIVRLGIGQKDVYAGTSRR